MSELGSQIIYKQLLQRHGLIRIPMIQRDYAQGRPSEEEVLEDFLAALESALKKPADDPTLPLNLDFIYGSVEGKDDTRFLPLDGQQRLTTLFLLHWYLAWKDQKWEDFGLMFRASRQSRFSYSVRPSSNEFFDDLVCYEPTIGPEDVQNLRKLIEDQPWYFRSWRLDPTIQSALAVLDAIHDRFASHDNCLFERLIDEIQPAITFQLLDLDNFGLSDDLYIKMNARGKPLTPFETFKARYEQELEKQFPGDYLVIGAGSFTVAEFVARRMDTTWTDLFWIHRDKKSNLYDDAIMNVFRAVALITRNPEKMTYLKDVEVLRNEARAPSYSDFHNRGWLDQEFTTTLIRLLETWSGPCGGLRTQLPEVRYFNETSIFEKVVSVGSTLSSVEAVQFAGYVIFIKKNHESLNSQSFQEWMRIVFNLSVNTSYDRAADMQRSMAGLLKLAEETNGILAYLASSEKPISGFSEQQVAEEKLKAELILAHPDWRQMIDRAEGHGYFRGQIEFLLDFAGIVQSSGAGKIADWDVGAHLEMQRKFLDLLEKAEAMFTGRGLRDLPEFRWERALLSIGDYLLPRGRNFSFLVNSPTDQASWKRLLRGSGPDVASSRTLLCELFGRLLGVDDLPAQLDSIIAAAKGLDPWIEAFVRNPVAIAYCTRRMIRWENEDEIYLLQTTQMNGTHSELFSYCLYVKLSTDLKLKSMLSYYHSIGTDYWPGIILYLPYNNSSIRFDVEYRSGQYIIFVQNDKIVPYSLVEGELQGSLGFVKNVTRHQRTSSVNDIEQTLVDLVQKLAAIPVDGNSSP